jgi:hypothetical protein
MAGLPVGADKLHLLQHLVLISRKDVQIHFLAHRLLNHPATSDWQLVGAFHRVLRQQLCLRPSMDNFSNKTFLNHCRCAAYRFAPSHMLVLVVRTSTGQLLTPSTSLYRRAAAEQSTLKLSAGYSSSSNWSLRTSALKMTDNFAPPEQKQWHSKSQSTNSGALSERSSDTNASCVRQGTVRYFPSSVKISL